MPKDRLRHLRADLPAYQFVVYGRPVSVQKHGKKKKYEESVASEAKKHIKSPIQSDDIEIEICWATSARPGIRADIDNIIKPTLDALNGVAFDDDKRVRSVTATLIDKTKKSTLSGYVEDIGPLIYAKREDAVQIAIYSDARLNELGGKGTVRRQRSEEFNRRLRKQCRNKFRKRRAAHKTRIYNAHVIW